MINSPPKSASRHQTSSPRDGKKGYSWELIQKTYKNNRQSSYTEAIELLDDQFDYDSNRNHYWSEPEQSILFGTPFTPRPLRLKS